MNTNKKNNTVLDSHSRHGRISVPDVHGNIGVPKDTIAKVSLSLVSAKNR